MNSISLRFALSAVAGSLLILALIGGVNYYFLKQELLHDAAIKAELIEKNAVNEIHNILTQTKTTIDAMKERLKNEGYGKETLDKVIKEGLAEESYFFGSAMAFEPNVLINKSFCPYYYKKDHTILYKDTSLNKDYNYTAQQWYTLPKNAKKDKWSEPYFDDGGGDILMTTYGTPVMHNDKFAGVLTIDLSLEKLEEIISAIHILKSGYAFLLSKEHKILVHKDNSKIMQYYHKGESLKFNKVIKVKDHWIYYAHVASTGLILGILLPEDELFSSLNKISLISIVLAILGSILLVITMLIISRRITRPIKELTKLTQEISHGNFEEKITLPKTKDEIYHLSHSINRMQDSIQNYISDLKDATIKEERIESELNIAKSIQMSMLPKTLKENPYISIAATLKPAKAVGGDFYDFFYLDKDQLCFVVADVSGKGVPAAMFMSITMSYIRAYSSKQLPSKIVKRVNNTIAKNNDANMFVTLFLGILDIKSGEFTYVNAGHTSPYIINKNGTIEALPSSKNPVVGAFEGIEYDDHTMTVEKDEKLFLYTDGVTEAFSEEDEQFGEKRLESILTEQHPLSEDATIDIIQNAIIEFAGACEQSDDITMLVIAKK